MSCPGLLPSTAAARHQRPGETGGYTLIQALCGQAGHDGQAAAAPAGQRTGRRLVTGAALSIDNLAVGFALGTFHVSLALAAIVIGAISAHRDLLCPCTDI